MELRSLVAVANIRDKNEVLFMKGLSYYCIDRIGGIARTGQDFGNLSIC